MVVVSSSSSSSRSGSRSSSSSISSSSSNTPYKIIIIIIIINNITIIIIMIGHRQVIKQLLYQVIMSLHDSQSTTIFLLRCLHVLCMGWEDWNVLYHPHCHQHAARPTVQYNRNQGGRGWVGWRGRLIVFFAPLHIKITTGRTADLQAKVVRWEESSRETLAAARIYAPASFLIIIPPALSLSPKCQAEHRGCDGTQYQTNSLSQCHHLYVLRNTED